MYKETGLRPSELTLHLAAEYARFANTAAGICAGRRGAIPALPTLDEVEDERYMDIEKAELVMLPLLE